MKATGIVRRIDDIGRVVIPKEIRRTMRIREGDPLLITLTWCEAMVDLAKRFGINI
ncbi:MAG: AbrB/MazE/SpoVT family DNA-binding domain-containing protein [Clostridia bacterium]|nr:AbrB/MazE/SpoVT family DNA-binding domain-containing protein [Clostridia bacterium]